MVNKEFFWTITKQRNAEHAAIMEKFADIVRKKKLLNAAAIAERARLVAA